MGFLEYWYLVWLVGGASISSSTMEYGLVVSKSSSKSRPRSVPRRSISEQNIFQDFVQQFSVHLAVHELQKNWMNCVCVCSCVCLVCMLLGCV